MYYLLTKEEFGEAYNLQELEDEDALKEAILEADKAGKEVKIAAPLEFRILTTIEISEFLFEALREGGPDGGGGNNEEEGNSEANKD